MISFKRVIRNSWQRGRAVTVGEYLIFAIKALNEKRGYK